MNSSLISFQPKQFAVIESPAWSKITKRLSLNVKQTEAVVQRCSVEKVFLEISQNSQENTCTRVSFFNKVVGLSLQLY